jgi:hypothetical protein
MASQRLGEFLVDRCVRAAHCLGFIGHGISSRPNPTPPFAFSEVNAAG